jgi:predicted nuclease of predicted toxin-antitoxin system
MATGRIKVLFDESISHRLVDFLHREFRVAELYHLRTLGWSGRRDIEWIELAVKGEFAIVTGDRNEATRGSSRKTSNH